MYIPATHTMDGAQKASDPEEVDGEDVPNTDEAEPNTLWEQMTAREERNAARLAGMRAGDWQAERQLQEALRESRMEGRESGKRTGEGAQEQASSSVDVDFNAHQATRTSHGEQQRQKTTPKGNHKPDRTGPEKIMSANAARKDSGAEQQKQQDRLAPVGVVSEPDTDLSGASEDRNQQDAEEVEDDEDFGKLELFVTEDGGIVPVVSADITAANDVGAAARSRADAHDAEEKAPPQASDDRRGAARCRLSEGDGWGESKMEHVGRVGKRSVAAGASRTTAESVKKGGAGGAGVGVGRDGDGRVAKGATDRGVQALGDVAVRKELDRECRIGVDADGEGGAMGVEGDAEKGQEAEEEQEPPPDIILTLDDDVLCSTMLYLQPEDVTECRAVSSRWEFPLGEAVFEGLCRRTYLVQSANKILNIQRWRSWQRMFRLRPRLRTTGIYSLKTTYYKKPVRDMSTSWVPGQVLECTYYRYLRFFGDGRVAYGLTHEPPKEFVKMLEEEHPKVVFGTYTISKWDVRVQIPTPWAFVYFTLQLANGERGRFTHLLLQRHSSIPRNDPRAGRCHHSVKSSDVFTFRRVWQF